MRAVHISYATPNLSQAGKLLLKSARRFDLDSHLYTTAHPVLVELAQKYKSIMDACLFERTAGCAGGKMDMAF